MSCSSSRTAQVWVYSMGTSPSGMDCSRVGFSFLQAISTCCSVRSFMGCRIFMQSASCSLDPVASGAPSFSPSSVISVSVYFLLSFFLQCCHLFLPFFLTSLSRSFCTDFLSFLKYVILELPSVSLTDSVLANSRSLLKSVGNVMEMSEVGVAPGLFSQSLPLHTLLYQNLIM